MDGGTGTRRRFARIGAQVGLMALAVASAGVGAQTTPAPAPVPSLPTRGQVEQPAVPQPSADAGPRVSRTRPEAAPCPLLSSPLRVTLTGVRFDAAGRDALPPAVAQALADIAVPAGERPVSVVCEVRDAANAALAHAGFIASVQVPPQKLGAGELRLSVVLARITEIRVRGEAGRWRPVLARLIERLRALDPLNERDAERVLLLAGDVPGLDVQLALRPAGTGPGEVIGELAVATRRVSLLANLQNYGSPALGRETAYLRVDVAGLLAADDAVYLGGSTTTDRREQQVVQVGYRAGAPAKGFTFGPRVTVAWSRPDIGGLDLRSTTVVAGFDATQALVRSVRRNLSVSAGFEATEQRSRVYAGGTSNPLNLDRLRDLYVRLDGRASAPRSDGLDAWSLAGSLEARRGIAAFGATRPETVVDGYTPSRFEGDGVATILRGTLGALLRATRGVSVYHQLVAQWADRPLLNFDKQAIGNLTIGYGYDPGSNSGDRLIGAHSELRLDARVAKVPSQAFAFADNVWLWNLESFSTEASRHLRSVGGGVRLRLPGPLLLEGIYAHPLDHALRLDERRAADRLLVSLTVQLSPSFL